MKFVDLGVLTWEYGRNLHDYVYICINILKILGILLDSKKSLVFPTKQYWSIISTGYTSRLLAAHNKNQVLTELNRSLFLNLSCFVGLFVVEE